MYNGREAIPSLSPYTVETQRIVSLRPAGTPIQGKQSGATTYRIDRRLFVGRSLFL
jgi:hypothetical protein